MANSTISEKQNSTCKHKCYFFFEKDNNKAKQIEPTVLPSNVIHKNIIESKLIVLEATK